MSNELKCPRCDGRLVYWGATGALLKCSQCSFGWGEEELWQELIRTRKALDVAVGALKDNLSQANFREMLDASRFHCIRTKCELALEQITALEQKETK